MDSNNPKKRLLHIISKRYQNVNGVIENGMLNIKNHVIPLDPLLKTYERIQNSKLFTRLPPLFDSTENFPISDMYVELTVAESLEIADPLRLIRGLSLADEQEARHKQKRARHLSLNECVNNTQHNNIVILGDPGSGKTSLLKYLCLQIAKGENKRWAFPVFISLRQYWLEKEKNPDLSLLNFSISSFFSDQASIDSPIASNVQYHPQLTPSMMLENILVDISSSEKKHVLFLLDGLDEIASNTHAIETVSNDIRQLGEKFSWVLTSRYTGFYSSITDDIRYEVVSLHYEAITNLVTNWFKNTRQKDAKEKTKLILEQISENSRLMEMSRNPFLLTLLCYVQNFNKSSQLPIQRNEIYDEIINLIQKQLRTKYQDNNLFRNTEFQYIAKFCYYLYTKVDNAPLQLFQHDHWYKCALPDNPPDFERHFLSSRLLNSWKKQGDYHFVHLTFQEYFVAQYLSLLSPDQYTTYLFNPQWRVIYRFLAGILGQKKDKKAFNDLVRYLLNPVDKMKLLYVEAAMLLLEAEVEDSTSILGYDVREKLWYLWCNDKSYLKNSSGEALALLSPNYVIKNHLDIIERKKEEIALKKSIQLLALTNSKEADELLIDLFKIPLHRHANIIIKALADKNKAEINTRIIAIFIKNKQSRFWSFCRFAKVSRQKSLLPYLVPYLSVKQKNLDKYAVLFKAIKAIGDKSIANSLLRFVNQYPVRDLTVDLIECLISLQSIEIKAWVITVLKDASINKKIQQKILLCACSYNMIDQNSQLKLLNNKEKKWQKKCIKAISLQAKHGIKPAQNILEKLKEIAFSNAKNQDVAFEALLAFDPRGVTHGQIKPDYKNYYRKFLDHHDEYIVLSSINILAEIKDIQSFKKIFNLAISAQAPLSVRGESIRALSRYKELDKKLIIETLHTIYQSENQEKNRFLANAALDTLAKIDLYQISDYLHEPLNHDVFSKLCATESILLFDDYYYDKLGIKRLWYQDEQPLLDPLKEAHEQIEQLKRVCHFLLANKYAKKTGRIKKKPVPLFNKTQFTHDERINSIDVNTGNRLLKGMYINPDKAKVLQDWIQYKFPWVFAGKQRKFK